MEHNVLDFRAQAEQFYALLEVRVKQGQKAQAIDFLVLKFKTLFDQGVASGRLYEREGVYPYASMHERD